MDILDQDEGTDIVVAAEENTSEWWDPFSR
jgi:hypothetical protein